MNEHTCFDAVNDHLNFIHLVKSYKNNLFYYHIKLL